MRNKEEVCYRIEECGNSGYINVFKNNRKFGYYYSLKAAYSSLYLDYITENKENKLKVEIIRYDRFNYLVKDLSKEWFMKKGVILR